MTNTIKKVANLKQFFQKPVLSLAYHPVLLLLACCLICPMHASAELNDSERDRIILDFDTYAEELFTTYQLPGMAIAITDRDKILYAKGFGVTSLESKKPVTPDTVFLINSMSKAFTSTVIGSLVDEEKLSWNDTVISILPDFALNDSKATREMTIGDLLVHNSGFWSYDGDLLVSMGLKPSEIVPKMRYLQMERPFRSGYGYNNLHYLVAAEVVNKTAGIPFQESLQERIFTPLGMNNTSTGFAFLSSSPDSGIEYASHHFMSSNGYIPIPMDKDHLYFEYQVIGAGGISSNVIDMAKWLRLWLNEGEYEGKRIVKSETVREICRPENAMVSEPGFNLSYAKGWVICRNSTLPYPLIMHNGGTGGMGSSNGFIPEERIGVVILSNGGSEGGVETLVDAFLTMISDPSNAANVTNISNFGDYSGPSYPSSPYPEPSNNTIIDPGYLVGTYQNDYYGMMNISVDSGAFVAELGPRPLRMNLTPVNSTAYLFALTPQIKGLPNPDGLFSCSSGPDGRVSMITVLGLTLPEEPPATFKWT